MIEARHIGKDTTLEQFKFFLRSTKTIEYIKLTLPQIKELEIAIPYAYEEDLKPGERSREVVEDILEIKRSQLLRHEVNHILTKKQLKA
jgi:hypothetical protein